MLCNRSPLKTWKETSTSRLGLIESNRGENKNKAAIAHDKPQAVRLVAKHLWIYGTISHNWEFPFLRKNLLFGSCSLNNLQTQPGRPWHDLDIDPQRRNRLFVQQTLLFLSLKLYFRQLGRSLIPHINKRFNPMTLSNWLPISASCHWRLRWYLCAHKLQWGPD